MRIAICTDIYLPQLSGVADSIAITSEQLRRLGHAIRIYAPAIGEWQEDPNVVRLPSMGVPGSAGSLAFVLPFGGWRDLRQFRPDLIHSHTFSTAGMFALRAAKRLKVPLVGTDHTFPADYLHYLKLDFAMVSRLIRRMAAWYYNQCDLVLAPSQAMIDQLRSSGMSAPARVMSNPIRTELFRPLGDKEALKRKLGIAAPAILLFGRIAREKNWDTALDVFAVVARRLKCELVAIGDGPYRKTFEQRVRERGLSSVFRFLGILRGEALAEAINACDLFLITSKTDTQSMAMLQAAACGLPIVAARAGGLPENVIEGKTGYLVDPDDREAFACKVQCLLEHGERARQMGARGRETVSGRLPEAIALQHQSLYEEVLSRRQVAA